jgi:putative GTP pyrophosphokinase
MNIPNRNEVWQRFEVHAERRACIVKDLADRIEQTLSPLIHPTIRGRTKDFDSYYKKVLKILKTESSHQIDDLMGIRIICPFIEDLKTVEDFINENFKVKNIEWKEHSFKEFGYESTHLLIDIPRDISEKWGKTDNDVAEIQIRTILQDAWAEVEHELVYKAEFYPSDLPLKRKLAAVNASLSLADIIFQEIRTHQRRYIRELFKRRESFFQKVEDESDAFLFPMEAPEPLEELPEEADDQLPESIDDLLLLALSAHNRSHFDRATSLYTRMLKLNPDASTSSLIFKHRGMANFAQSKYHEAIDDFTQSFELDEKSYKALYFRGLVKSVIRDYPGALDDFSLSLEIYPYQSFCLLRRGQSYYHTGDYPQALSDCNDSLAIEPSNETAQKFKELLQAKLKM